VCEGDSGDSMADLQRKVGPFSAYMGEEVRIGFEVRIDCESCGIL